TIRSPSHFRGNLRRWVAHHAHPGSKGHRIRPRSGFRSRKRGCRGFVLHRVHFPRPNFHHSHHYQRHHGGRFHPASFSSALGSGTRDRRSLGPDPTGGSRGCCSRILRTAHLYLSLLTLRNSSCTNAYSPPVLVYSRLGRSLGVPPHPRPKWATA